MAQDQRIKDWYAIQHPRINLGRELDNDGKFNGHSLRRVFSKLLIPMLPTKGGEVQCEGWYCNICNAYWNAEYYRGRISDCGDPWIFDKFLDPDAFESEFLLKPNFKDYIHKCGEKKNFVHPQKCTCCGKAI